MVKMISMYDTLKKEKGFVMLDGTVFGVLLFFASLKSFSIRSDLGTGRGCLLLLLLLQKAHVIVIVRLTTEYVP